MCLYTHEHTHAHTHMKRSHLLSMFRETNKTLKEAMLVQQSFSTPTLLLSSLSRKIIFGLKRIQ